MIETIKKIITDFLKRRKDKKLLKKKLEKIKRKDPFIYK